METVACREKPVKRKKLIYAVGSGTDSANLSLEVRGTPASSVSKTNPESQLSEGLKVRCLTGEAFWLSRKDESKKLWNLTQLMLRSCFKTKWSNEVYTVNNGNPSFPFQCLNTTRTLTARATTFPVNSKVKTYTCWHVQVHPWKTSTQSLYKRGPSTSMCICPYPKVYRSISVSHSKMINSQELQGKNKRNKHKKTGWVRNKPISD